MPRKRHILVALQVLICFCIMVIIFNDSVKRANNRPALRFVQIYNESRLENGVNYYHCMTTKTIPPFFICPHNVTDDIYISKSLQNDHIWEPRMTKILQDILARETNVTFIDIGANIGYFSLLAAAHGHRTVAVEPILNNIKLFQKSVIINQFQDNILILQNVISDVRSSRVALRLDRNNQGSARVLNQNEFKGPDDIRVGITSIKLDDLIGLIQTPDVIIKIDVEGHECKVLAGSTQLFQLFNIKAVFTEWQKMAHRKYIYGSACGQEDIHKLAHQLSKNGLTPYDIQHGHKLDISSSVKWMAGDIVWNR